MWGALGRRWSRAAVRPRVTAGPGSGGQFAADTTLLTAAQLGAALLGLATSALAARWLGPAAFGTAAVVMAYPSVVGGFLGAKTSPITVRYAAGFIATSRHEEALAVCKLGFGVDLALASIASALTVVLVLALGDLPGASEYGVLVVIFAFTRPFNSFRNTAVAILSTLRRFGVASVLYVTERFIVLAAVGAALALNAGVEEFIIATALGQSLAGIAWLVVSSAILRRKVGAWWRAPWSFLREFRGELSSMLSWNFVGVTFGGAITQVPVIMLGALHSATDAGYFRLASSIASTADYAEAALIRVASPPLAEAHALGNRAEFRRLIALWRRREGPLAALLVVVGMAALPLIVPLVYGGGYTPMVWGAEFMLLGIAVSTALFFVSPALFAQGRIKAWVLAYGVYTSLTLGVGALLAPNEGFLAFALLAGLGMVVMNAILAIIVIRGTSGEPPNPTRGPQLSNSLSSGASPPPEDAKKEPLAQADRVLPTAGDPRVNLYPVLETGSEIR